MESYTAQASGWWTATATSIGGIITAPLDTPIWAWMLGLVVTALLSIASSLIVALVMAWFNDYLRDRRERRKIAQKGTFIQ